VGDVYHVKALCMCGHCYQGLAARSVQLQCAIRNAWCMAVVTHHRASVLRSSS
jgi:hypothetical protein